MKWYYDNAFGDASATHSWGRVRMAEVTAAGQGDKANKHFYTYDGRGLPATDVITVSNTYTSGIYNVNYSYDIGKRLTSVNYPDPTGEQVGVQYNRQGMGMPVTLTSSASAYPSPVSDVQYNERGQITSMVQGSGGNVLTTAYAYTVRGWLTNTLVTAPNGIGGTNTMLNLGLTYTANGNVKSMSNQDPGGNGSNGPTFTNTYFYDGLNRLKSASSTSSLGGGLFPDEGYSFDDLGRMSSRSIGSTSYDYTYGDSSHVDAPTGYMGNGYSYDGAGNQTSGTVKSVSQNRTYDAQNRVSSVTTGTTILSFVYDANDKRVVQNVTVGSNVKRTLYVGNLYEEEISNPSRPYTVYYMMGEKMVGLRRGNQAANNGQYRMVTDHLGSTSLMVDTASPPTVVDRSYYKPYGEVAFESGSRLTTVGYTGKRLDGDSGLMYYGARYYDPVLSMFVSADPTVPDAKHAMDFNKYLYVRGNPFRYIDTSGYGPNDYYLFVNGCVFNGWDCDKSNSSQWGEYNQFLKDKYEREGWGYGDESRGSYRSTPIPYAVWAASHVKFISVAGDVQEGAAQVKYWIEQFHGSGNVNLIGHSEGGAAIWQYIINAAMGKYATSTNAAGIDRRITSITTIDSPLWRVEGGNNMGAYVPGKGIMDLDGYLCGYTRLCKNGDPTTINIRTVDSPDDVIGHSPIAGIDPSTYIGNPHYQKCQNGSVGNCNRIEWHGWTGTHMAQETNDFLSRVWR